jgi:hypothetical protein
MEAAFFRNFAAVNGLRPPEAARETRAIDSRKTSEVHASMRKDGLVRGGERQGPFSPRKSRAFSQVTK